MQRPSVSRYFAYALILILVGSLFSAVLPVFQLSYASHTNIDVEIVGGISQTYEEDDDVAIDGTIDDVQDNLDSVEIIIEDSENDEVESQSVDLGTSDNFDLVYNIAGGDPDGAYTVEVQYDDESVFTYFIVDNTDDSIRVILGDTIYQAGDEVEIAGEVDSVVSDEPDVEITVLDPENGEIVDQDNAELGEGTLSSDEFEYTFDLDSDADHGRYAVIVSYDSDDQQGWALFEIEDDDSGGGTSGGDGDSGSDGDIEAEIGEATYAPGDTVSVTGTINNFDTANELEIIVEDPDGGDIESDNDVSVQSDDDFTFEFDLDDNADEGQYDVTLTYDGDELVLTFDVDEGGGSTGGGSSSITVRLNKSSYLAGELVTVTGTVPQVVEDEVVSILLYEPDGRVVLDASKYVEPTSDETYSGTIRLDSDLEIDDDYSIKVAYDGRETEVEFDITGQAAGSAAITVDTDRDTYQSGATVRITGSVSDDLLEPTEDQVLLRFNAPDNNPCRIDPADLANDGSFSYSLVLGGKCGLTGEYEVIATYNQEDGKTTFVLEGELGEGGSTYNLNVEGRSYQIEYELSGGSIDSMFARTGEKKLVIDIDADEEGQLTLVLPRQVMDAIRNGQDIAYVVTIEDDSGETTTVDFEESNSTNQARTLVIDYPAGGGRIEIAGTQIVPEFGAIVVVIMTVAIVGFVIAIAKHGKDNNISLFRQ